MFNIFVILESLNKMKITIILDMVKTKMERVRDEYDLSLWTCTDCDYSSKKSSDVYKHVERVHLDLVYMCQYCPNSFKACVDLKTHLKRVHKNFKS